MSHDRAGVFITISYFVHKLTLSVPALHSCATHKTTRFKQKMHRGVFKIFVYDTSTLWNNRWTTGAVGLPFSEVHKGWVGTYVRELGTERV